MLSIPELEAHFSCIYPNTVSAETSARRQKDINELQGLVTQSKAEHSLRYGEKEERLVIARDKIRKKYGLEKLKRCSLIENDFGI